MCPDCIRGLTPITKEVCRTCAGTGVWNPLSASTSIMSEDTNVAVEVAPEEGAPEVAPEVTPENTEPEVEVVVE